VTSCWVWDIAVIVQKQINYPSTQLYLRIHHSLWQHILCLIKKRLILFKKMKTHCCILISVFDKIISQDAHRSNIDVHLRNRCCNGKGMFHIFCVCVYSLSYPACSAHASNFDLCPVWLYHIFPHYLINGIFFGKLLNIKCVFWFSPQHLPQTSVILRRFQWGTIINVHVSVFTESTHYSCHIEMKLQFFFDIFFQEIHIKFHEHVQWELNSSTWTDGQTGVTKLIVIFCTFVNAP
jgi:hypothetical protein